MKSIIELILERESQKVVMDYCNRNERLILDPKSKGRFHSTVYFSENYPLFPDPKLLLDLKDKLPIKLNPQTYFFDVFERCLVLRYDDEKVREINEMLKEDIERQRENVWPNLNSCGIRTVNQFNKEEEICKYFNFNPHLTFSKNFKEEELKKLPPFEEFLILKSTNFIFKY